MFIQFLVLWMFLHFWVDEEKMANAGLTEIKTKEDFEKYVEANSSDGKYGYGDAWEKIICI